MLSLVTHSAQLHRLTSQHSSFFVCWLTVTSLNVYLCSAPSFHTTAMLWGCWVSQGARLHLLCHSLSSYPDAFFLLKDLHAFHSLCSNAFCTRLVQWFVWSSLHVLRAHPLSGAGVWWAFLNWQKASWNPGCAYPCASASTALCFRVEFSWTLCNSPYTVFFSPLNLSKFCFLCLEYLYRHPFLPLYLACLAKSGACHQPLAWAYLNDPQEQIRYVLCLKLYHCRQQNTFCQFTCLLPLRSCMLSGECNHVHARQFIVSSDIYQHQAIILHVLTCIYDIL